MSKEKESYPLKNLRKTVIYELGKKRTHIYEPVTSLPSTLLILLLGVYLLLGFLTQLVEDDLVKVVMTNDLEPNNSVTFSEESAWVYLRTIVGTSPRVAGTEYHLNQTIVLKGLVDQIAAEATIPVHTDWQLVDGDYFLNFTGSHLNVYRNLSNVIAVLEGESGFTGDVTNTSLLVNCHYDSVPFALGASDNAVFCAVMLETLSKLSKRGQKYKHNVVFLFNGAEENPLQASHAFLKHPWARGVTSVINLDAGGANGKANVFQVTDPRVLSMYRKQTHKPAAQSVGEFLFSSGIIPSDTDFRIWRDFGQFYGVDIAFVKWGAVYHTRYDNLDVIKEGVLQYAGNMVLNLVYGMGDSDIMDEQIPPTAAVYYDFLNVFMIQYTYVVGHVVDTLIVLVTGLTVAYYVWTVGWHWATFRDLLICMSCRVICLISGIAVSGLLLVITAASTRQLRYLTEPWCVVPMYWIPFLVAALAASQGIDYYRYREKGVSRSIRSLESLTASRAVLGLVLLVSLCIPSSVTVRYVLSVTLLLLDVGLAVTLTAVRIWNLKAWQHLLLQCTLSLIPVMFLMTLSLRLLALMLPIMGRTPTNVPDYLVGAICIGLCALVATTLSGVELLFSRRFLWYMLGGMTVVCTIVMFVPWYPYRDDGPATQRHYWFHTTIQSYPYNSTSLSSQVSGVVVTKHDAYSTLTVEQTIINNNMNLETRTDFDADCESFVHCNLPLYRARFAANLKDALFIYTGPPAQFSPQPSLTQLNSTCTGESCLLWFRMTGPPHNLISVWPRTSIQLTGWTFDAAPESSFTQLERPVYVIIQSYATYSADLPSLDFGITFMVPISLQNQPIVDISHHAHKINHPEDFTQEYQNLVDSMPKYFNIASFMTFRTNYVF